MVLRGLTPSHDVIHLAPLVTTRTRRGVNSVRGRGTDFVLAASGYFVSLSHRHFERVDMRRPHL